MHGSWLQTCSFSAWVMPYKLMLSPRRAILGSRCQSLFSSKPLSILWSPAWIFPSVTLQCRTPTAFSSIPLALFFLFFLFYKELFTLQSQQTVYLFVCQPHGHWPMFAKFEKMRKEGAMTVSSWAPPVKVSIQTFKEGRRREGWVISSLALLTATLFGGNNKFLLRVLSDPN